MGLGLILDNICVAIGIVILWLIKGCSYSLDQETHKIAEGVCSGSNWLEFGIGLSVLVIILGGLVVFGIIPITSK